MLRFIGLMVLLSAVFWLGYYTGQRPIGELRQTITELSKKVAHVSRSAVDTTIGFERNLRQHQDLVEAKAMVIQAKSELLDRNFGSAAKELAKAEEHLEKSIKSSEGADRTSTLKPTLEKMRSAKGDLASGKSLPKSRLDEIQKEIDMALDD
jgi:hypothetical protein